MAFFSAPRTLTIELAAAAPDKPDEGEPCNGCGLCCLLTTCPLARLRFCQIKGPCPALIWQEQGHEADPTPRYVCGFLTQPKRFFPLPWISETRLSLWLKHAIAAGIGCDCSARYVDGDIE